MMAVSPGEPAVRRLPPCRSLALLLLLATGPAALAAEAPADAKAKPEKDGKAEEKIEDRLVDTKHAVTIDGAELRYTATTGTLAMRDEEGKPKATIFFIAYVKDGVKDPAGRPLTFSFNGGPGSSSVWLHLGVLGPRRVVMDEEGFPPPPPYRLVDNDRSILDVTDLVFIDPVMTGYSRPAPEEDAKQFHGLKQDVESVGEFIRLYTTRYGRWSSPKFLIGESYGTTRAAGLAGHLQERHGLYLNGVMLVSSILNFQTARFDVGNDLPYVLFLPTYTATAWYHRRLDPDLQRDLRATLAESERFAAGEYAASLLRGDALPEADRRRLAESLARYTGLSAEYVANANLRLSIQRFTKELLRDHGRTVGRLDSRYSGRDRDAAGETTELDPSYAAIQGPFTATLNDLVRRTLKFESDLPYEILTGRVQPWSYAEHENRYVNVGETLRQAMARNPSLRVFVGSGLYDLATPYFATDYTFDHLQLPPELRGNVTKATYDAGHMMYVKRSCLDQMKRDLAAFIASAVPRG
jgi:carboxypeptidase C (cathepsin A)